MSRLFCSVFGAMVVVGFTGCGGSPPSNDAYPQTSQGSAFVQTFDGRGSWMDPSAARGDLLYVTDGVAKVYVYTYPQGRHVGTLTAFNNPMGECVDASGDVFVVWDIAATGSPTDAKITEYRHGGTKPIQTLDNGTAATGCAIDPTTEELAVAGSWDNYGSYLGALGTYSYDTNTNQYTPITMQYLRAWGAFRMCGYDAQGNLFLSSDASNSTEAALTEVPARNSSSFEAISVSKPLYSYGAPVSVQWDGKYLAVSSTPSQSPVTLYRLSISGSTATIVGSTTLKSRSNVMKTSQVWIQGRSVVDADYFQHRAGVDRWSYPVAGSPHTVVPNGIQATLYGVVISKGS